MRYLFSFPINHLVINFSWSSKKKSIAAMSYTSSKVWFSSSRYQNRAWKDFTPLLWMLCQESTILCVSWTVCCKTFWSDQKHQRSGLLQLKSWQFSAIETLQATRLCNHTAGSCTLIPLARGLRTRDNCPSPLYLSENTCPQYIKKKKKSKNQKSTQAL